VTVGDFVNKLSLVPGGDLLENIQKCLVVTFSTSFYLSLEVTLLTRLRFIIPSASVGLSII